MKAKSRLLLFLLLFTAFIYGHAQDRCGSVEYQQLILNRLKSPEKIQQFENWLSITKSGKQTTARTESVITIPVVVHIIHNGEPIGQGLNIPDEQIFSQIEVLNEDFRRANADKVNTPSVFTSVAADLEVEFVLAKRDPEGLATNGIVRVLGTQTSWKMSDDEHLKALSYWPAEDYLNIWVSQIDLLGYAQFPVSDLEGLEDYSINRLTDGVVIDFEAFGSIEKYPGANLKSKYALGRTTTHEVGHFLGLRHIWGDGGCTKDDFCEDTPTASDSNTTSDCTFPGRNSCDDGENDLPDMFQNYMDYTADACMNLFTEDQKGRTIIVMENSPRRLSLTTSKGDESPVQVANDLGIRTIQSVPLYACSQEISPLLEVRNYGTNDITQTTIETLLDGVVVNATNFDFLLRPLEIRVVELPTITLNLNATQTLSFAISMTNNVADGNAENNTKASTIYMPTEVALPHTKTFDETQNNWNLISSPSGRTAWEPIQLSYKNAGDSALILNNYNNEYDGEQAILVSPVFDLSITNFALLSFEVAHHNYPGSSDSLKVIVSTDCGNTFSIANQLYAKTGDNLATVDLVVNDEFFPTSASDWRTDIIDLSAYTGKPIQVGFIGVNDFGNNIFIDNISLIISEFTDLALREISSPSPVLGYESPELAFEVINLGSKPIQSFSYTVISNTESPGLFHITGIDIKPGQVYTIEHGNLRSTTGGNTIRVELSNVNNNEDEQADNNAIDYRYTVDFSKNTIPLRENFSGTDIFIVNSQHPNLAPWQNLEGMKWVNGSKHTAVSAEEWLVTPSLDLSQYTEASLFFDVAYALPETGISDELQVRISENNGLSYLPAIYSKSGSGLASTTTVQNNWQPETLDEWNAHKIDLTNYAGLNEVRVAFIFNSNNANNIFLDNVEFYSHAFPDTTHIDDQVVVYPNPLFPQSEELHLKFNLDKRQNVNLTLLNSQGQIIYKQGLENALNQNFEVSLDDLQQGIYLLHLAGENLQKTLRLMVSK